MGSCEESRPAKNSYADRFVREVVGTRARSTSGLRLGDDDT
jgi:hypothetical protein